jgi:hypothetical protein
MIMTVVVAVVTCCGSVAAVALREGAPVAAAVLPVTLRALDERSLMGTDASDLRALASARGGAVGATLRTQNERIRILPLEIGAFGGTAAYLKAEKPRFLFLESLTDAVAVASVAAAAPQTPPRCAPAHPRRTPPFPWTARRRALPRPSRALAPLPPPRLSMRGAQAPTSKGGLPPVAFFLFSLSRRRVLRGRRGRESLLLAQLESSSLCSWRSRRRILRSFLRTARSCSRRCVAHVRSRARGVDGSDRAAFMTTLCWEE